MTAVAHANGNGNGNGNGVGRRRGRPVPSDLDAEEATLGAMLLGRNALIESLDFVTGADFYDPRNRAIFEGIDHRLNTRGGIDAGLVADQLRVDGTLDLAGGRERLFELVAHAPMTVNAKHYARVVAERARSRRAIEVGGELTDAGYDEDDEAIERLLSGAGARIDGTMSEFHEWEEALDLDELLAQDYSHEWIVEDLLARGEWVVLTGGEGGGKTTLIRQWNVQLAAGIHPFTLEPIEPRRVFHLDLQDSHEQSKTEYARLARVAGDRLDGTRLKVAHRRGVNLLDKLEARAFENSIKRARADVVAIGPIYQAFTVPKGVSAWDEGIADQVADVLDGIGVRCGVAWIIEAHSPHGTDNNRAGFRPIGASVWLRRPDFGFGLAPRRRKDSESGRAGVELRRWRGDRARGRTWPDSLDRGGDGRWPWLAPDEEVL